jgi:hypothetical protein
MFLSTTDKTRKLTATLEAFHPTGSCIVLFSICLSASTDFQMANYGHLSIRRFFVAVAVAAVVEFAMKAQKESERMTFDGVGKESNFDTMKYTCDAVKKKCVHRESILVGWRRQREVERSSPAEKRGETICLRAFSTWHVRPRPLPPYWTADGYVLLQ